MKKSVAKRTAPNPVDQGQATPPPNIEIYALSKRANVLSSLIERLHAPEKSHEVEKYTAELMGLNKTIAGINITGLLAQAEEGYMAMQQHVIALQKLERIKGNNKAIQEHADAARVWEKHGAGCYEDALQSHEESGVPLTMLDKMKALNNISSYYKYREEISDKENYARFIVKFDAFEQELLGHKDDQDVKDKELLPNYYLNRLAHCSQERDFAEERKIHDRAIASLAVDYPIHAAEFSLRKARGYLDEYEKKMATQSDAIGYKAAGELLGNSFALIKKIILQVERKQVEDKVVDLLADTISNYASCNEKRNNIPEHKRDEHNSHKIEAITWYERFYHSAKARHKGAFDDIAGLIRHSKKKAAKSTVTTSERIPPVAPNQDEHKEEGNVSAAPTSAAPSSASQSPEEKRFTAIYSIFSKGDYKTAGKLYEEFYKDALESGDYKWAARALSGAADSLTLPNSRLDSGAAIASYKQGMELHQQAVSCCHTWMVDVVKKGLPLLEEKQMLGEVSMTLDVVEIGANHVKNTLEEVTARLNRHIETQQAERERVKQDIIARHGEEGWYKKDPNGEVSEYAKRLQYNLRLQEEMFPLKEMALPAIQKLRTTLGEYTRSQLPAPDASAKAHDNGRSWASKVQPALKRSHSFSSTFEDLTRVRMNFGDIRGADKPPHLQYKGLTDSGVLR